MERTFVMLKPDCLNRAMLGKVISRLEEKGLKLIGMKMLRFNDAIAKEHYAHLASKPFFPSIVEFMKRSPVVATAWEGKDAVEVVRKAVGATNGREAPPGTIRGDYSMSVQANLIHASDSKETAKKEIGRFFKDEELFEWEPAAISYTYSASEV